MVNTRARMETDLADLLRRLKTEPLGTKSFSLSELVAMTSWQSRMSDHFVLQYYDDTDSSDGLLDTFIDEFERIYADLMDWMKIVPRTKQDRIACETKLTCIVVGTSSPRTFGTIGSTGVLFYLLDPQQDPQYMRKFRHEIAHLVWGRSYGEAPPLFNEGLAVYAVTASDPTSGDRQMPRVAGQLLDSLPPLVELAQTAAFWDAYSHGRPVYQMSAHWVRYLIEQWGWDRLGGLFLASDYEDADIDGHFQLVYGHDMATVEADWRSWMARNGEA